MSGQGRYFQSADPNVAQGKLLMGAKSRRTDDTETDAEEGSHLTIRRIRMMQYHEMRVIKWLLAAILAVMVLFMLLFVAAIILVWPMVAPLSEGLSNAQSILGKFKQVSTSPEFDQLVEDVPKMARRIRNLANMSVIDDTLNGIGNLTQKVRTFTSAPLFVQTIENVARASNSLPNITEYVRPILMGNYTVFLLEMKKGLKLMDTAGTMMHQFTELDVASMIRYSQESQVLSNVVRILQTSIAMIDRFEDPKTREEFNAVASNGLSILTQFQALLASLQTKGVSLRL